MPARSKVLLSTLFVAGSALAQGKFPNNLMPQPAELSARSGDLPITSQLRIAVDGPPDALLQRAVERLLYRLEQRTAIHIDGSPSGPNAAAIQIRVADHSLQRPVEGMDESYTLEINDASATLSAPNDFGAMHGMETLLQLVASAGAGYGIPAVHIADSP